MKGIIQIAEKSASKKIHIEQGDYIGADGLLVCGKCHTSKQGRYEMPWGPVTPYIPCKCEQERKEKEQAEREALKRKERIARNRQKAFPEADMSKCTFDKDDGKNEKVGKIARNYVENFETMLEKAKGLVFFGDVGTGKTFIAACIVNALLDKGYPVMMLDFDRIRNTLQSSFDGRQEYLDSFHRCPLLVIDDLGMESKSEYMQEIVYSVIDARCKAKLPLVVTTNLTSEQLKNPKDMQSRRIYSRLLEMCMPIEVKGVDKRREKCVDSFAELKDILGL
jgi:DNA replication protein DnaC